jgi:hypothetical protein
MTTEPDWLLPEFVDTDRAGAMRFFLQPRWAPGGYEEDEHGFRRRTTPAYTEFEVEVRFVDGSVVGVVYVLPHSDSSVLVATCFETTFQPIRRILFGPGDERQRMRFANELQRARPMFFMATSNGIYNELGNGALIQYTDPSDGITKTLFVCVEGNRAPGADIMDERGMNTMGVLIETSVSLLGETQNPLDEAGLRRSAEIDELRDTAGGAAKWLFQNAGNIRDIVSILSG